MDEAQEARQAQDNSGGVNDPTGEKKKFQIQIDRVHYTVSREQMTGRELRQVPQTPIGPDLRWRASPHARVASTHTGAGSRPTG
jgi:hypothetical protein